MPTEITHNNLQSTIDLTMGVYGRDLGHVADDVARVVDRFGVASARAGLASLRSLRPFRRPRSVIKGATIELSGEYSRMQETFRSLGFGLILATLLIYFLMAALFKSYRDAARHPLRRAAGPVRRGDDALPDRHRHQRPVAAGRDLHGGHRGVEHGAADRLRPASAGATRD